jgi:tyrosine-protein phosphatase SIW14
MGIALVVMMVLVPAVHYRQTYRYAKRLRTVSEAKVYRSGCLTAAGFRDAIAKYGIKTVINLQDESPDPAVPNHYFTFQTTPESEVCKSMGAKFVFLPVELVNGRDFPRTHAPTIDTFLKLMDDPASYPVLIHCRAGLHRTGVLTALYRQEYQGWSREEALRELKNNGFGEFVSSAANPYIVQYILQYERRSEEVGVRSEHIGVMGERNDE